MYSNIQESKGVERVYSTVSSQGQYLTLIETVDNAYSTTSNISAVNVTVISDTFEDEFDIDEKEDVITDKEAISGVTHVDADVEDEEAGEHIGAPKKGPYLLYESDDYIESVQDYLSKAQEHKDEKEGSAAYKSDEEGEEIDNIPAIAIEEPELGLDEKKIEKSKLKEADDINSQEERLRKKDLDNKETEQFQTEEQDYECLDDEIVEEPQDEERDYECLDDEIVEKPQPKEQSCDSLDTKRIEQPDNVLPLEQSLSSTLIL
ncbi:hypothetical protein KY361_05545 [Candidatus Woesearchaeota archaeon]|nr:hypothetical protein [Candidatus Woesearchaeota archaeon]